MARYTIALDCGHKVTEVSSQRGGQAVRGKLFPCDVCDDRTLVASVEVTHFPDDKKPRRT
jgi:hypothetical protein